MSAWRAMADEAVATDSPAATIASLQQSLVAATRDKPNATVEERYRALEPAIVKTHNLPYIAEFALRRQWAILTVEERQRFIEVFQRLSVMTYAARFGNVARDAFRPIEAGVPDANGRVQVKTAIKREGQPDVTFEYLLQRDGEDWKIINIVADGVSDLALKRAEYQRVFASGGIEGLIAELEQQTHRLGRG
ncbi:MAG TPA: ABC transporter substrate-binding protein [Gammaproteobacteria bacterium]|nr:ABC transporter substrate-binding protein [Gammaproteobacteria bacterium]